MENFHADQISTTIEIADMPRNKELLEHNIAERYNIFNDMLKAQELLVNTGERYDIFKDTLKTQEEEKKGETLEVLVNTGDQYNDLLETSNEENPTDTSLTTKETRLTDQVVSSNNAFVHIINNGAYGDNFHANKMVALSNKYQKTISNTVSNRGKKWSIAEEEELISELNNGKTISDIADNHHRTKLAIEFRITKNLMEYDENERSQKLIKWNFPIGRYFELKDEINKV